MRTIISQSVVLAAPAESLFEIYTDPAKHAAITGAPVAISIEPGSPSQAFNGALTGATLHCELRWRDGDEAARFDPNAPVRNST